MNTAFLPDPASLRVRVVRKEALTKDIVLIELASVDGQPLPTFTAGAHIDVQLPGGLTRQYSLCDTAAETYQIAVLKEPQDEGDRWRCTTLCMQAASSLSARQETSSS